MNPIGIVSGMAEELTALHTRRAINRLQGRIQITLDEHNDIPIVTAWAGCGKVCAAAATSLLLERYNCRAIIITGTAGRLNQRKTGTTFLITAATQHDYGEWSESEFKQFLPGRLPIGLPDPLDGWYGTTEALLEASEPAMLDPIWGQLPAKACIATGDQFVAGEQANRIFDRTRADLLDMEAAAVAQTCQLYAVPWIGAKAVSDDATELAEKHFTSNLRAAGNAAATLTKRLVQLI